MRAILLTLLLIGLTGPLLAQRNADPYVREADRYYAQMAYALSLIHISEPTRPY